MEVDTEKVDEAVLALLYLGLHEAARAWKEVRGFGGCTK
jgi:hypothetical protein